jgi:hypothetical protein
MINISICNENNKRKRYISGSTHLSTSTDEHRSTLLITNETLQKFISINYLNDIYEQVHGNDRLFFDKIRFLFNEFDNNDNEHADRSSIALTLQSQMILARNLTHTLSNNDLTMKTTNIQ